MVSEIGSIIKILQGCNKRDANFNLVKPIWCQFGKKETYELINEVLSFG